ncbi:hypothetical protein OAT67_07320 [Bacteriovoracaceae bacterium]|nr:hypothetical protein [Bacteriovoracaceae bacterium]
MEVRARFFKLATSTVALLFVEVETVFAYNKSFDLNLGYSYGTSDNLNSSRLGAISGKYSFLEAGTLARLNNQDNELLFLLDIKKKIHNDKVHSNNFDKMMLTSELGWKRRISTRDFLLVNSHGLKADDKEIDFEQNSLLGRDSKFKEFGMSVSYLKNFDIAQLYISSFYLKRDYSTLSNDENGNLFEDDYSAYGISAASQFELSSRTDLSIKGLVERKRYDERRSRFTEGTLDNSRRNPLEDLMNYNVINDLDIKGDFIDYKLSYQYTFQDDRTLGALDYDGHKASVDLVFSIGPLLLKPMFFIEEKKYETFVADVVNNPQAFEKRVDKNKSYSLPIEYKFSAATFRLNYSKTILDSNYLLEGYQESIIDFGVKYEVF